LVTIHADKRPVLSLKQGGQKAGRLLFAPRSHCALHCIWLFATFLNFAAPTLFWLIYDELTKRDFLVIFSYFPYLISFFFFFSLKPAHQKESNLQAKSNPTKRHRQGSLYGLNLHKIAEQNVDL
jgi:hypothetical protein